jgi:sugar/nucleoside kinase (ribokinase family)
VELIKNNAALGAKIAVAMTATAVTIKEARPITIIGGAAIDIISKSETITADSGNSHVGQISMHEGGSTRNTAECLGRLGLGPQVTFISGIGDDDKSVFLRNSLKKVSISDDGLCLKPGFRTACFNGVLGHHGSFLCGVADMEVLESIPKEHLDASGFQESKIVILDSNIGEETLEYVLKQSGKVQHVLYEPISQEKSERILQKAYLAQITCFKPNIVQLRHLISEI